MSQQANSVPAYSVSNTTNARFVAIAHALVTHDRVELLDDSGWIDLENSIPADCNFVLNTEGFEFTGELYYSVDDNFDHLLIEQEVEVEGSVFMVTFSEGQESVSVSHGDNETQVTSVYSGQKLMSFTVLVNEKSYRFVRDTDDGESNVPVFKFA